MDPTMKRRLLITFFGSSILLALSARACSAAGDEELWSGADARIEKHRKADALVSVVDAMGKPLPGAKVTVEQTRHAFLFGCNIFGWGRQPDEASEIAYRERYAALLNYATLGFYWPSYERRRGEPQHEYASQVAEWCREQGIETKGHPLAWNFADPAWLPNDPDEVRRLQMARIDNCVSRFKGLIERWDVVNEATHFEREEFVKRAPKMTSMWEAAGRLEFTRECFEHARQANPEATLLINDYRTDPPYERLIEQLVDADGKRLYDVIGIQSHMHGGAWPNVKIWDVCERFGRFGVPLHFTETTIVSGKRQWERQPGEPWPSTPEGEAQQAREVVRFYTMLFSHPAVEAITWWDFSDRGAWKQAPAGLIRADMSPKPAYEELMKLTHGKWWTRAELKTDDVGATSLRGFCGGYKVTVTSQGRKAVEKAFTLVPGKTAEWKITVE